MNSYEEYTQQIENNQRPSSKIFNRVKQVHVILFAILFFIFSLIIKDNSKTWVIIIFGLLVAVYFFSIMKQGGLQKQIPRHIAQEIARQDILREIGPGRVYPTGTTVNPLIYGRDQTWDEGDGTKLFKYWLGFKIKEPYKPEKEIIYQMNPFTGEWKGTIEAPTGFAGEEINDIKKVFPDTFIKEEKKGETT